MLSVHNEDHLLGTEIRCKINQVEEGSLGELVDCDAAQPDEELGTLFIIDAREGPAGLLS